MIPWEKLRLKYYDHETFSTQATNQKGNKQIHLEHCTSIPKPFTSLPNSTQASNQEGNKQIHLEYNTSIPKSFTILPIVHKLPIVHMAPVSGVVTYPSLYHLVALGSAYCISAAKADSVFRVYNTQSISNKF